MYCLIERLLILATFSSVVSVHAIAAQSQPGWRPLDGVYAIATGDLSAEEKCKDFGDAILELSKKQVGGGEEECKIINLVEKSTAELALNLSCTSDMDVEPYNEFMQIRKIDNDKIFLRETSGDRFNRPGAEMIYCSEKIQKLYEKQRSAE